jgi:hypothetical protein
MRESGKEQGELLAELLDRVKDMGDLAAALEKKVCQPVPSLVIGHICAASCTACAARRHSVHSGVMREDSATGYVEPLQQLWSKPECCMPCSASQEQENDHLTSLLQELSRTRAEAISLKVM